MLLDPILNNNDTKTHRDLTIILACIDNRSLENCLNNVTFTY